MSVEVSAPKRASVGSSSINPRANEAKEQIFCPQVFDWVMRGYVFSVGLLVDATDTATKVTLADTTPTVVLQSPTGGDTIVVPLLVTACITNDGGALHTLDLVVMKAAEDVTTTHAFSGGTTETGVQNHLTTYPMITPKSTIQHTVTSTALLVTDCIVIDHKEFPDAGLTAATWAEPGYRYDFASNPHALREGAALMMWAATASSAGKFRYCFTWAELPSKTYKP